MKVEMFFSRLAAHMGLICGIAVVVVLVLDWYNPYMDFMGHTKFLLYGLCASAIWTGLCRIFGSASGKRRAAKPWPSAGSREEQTKTRRHRRV